MVCEGLPAESYGFYILGSLTGTELVELQSHLDRNCVRCRSELAMAASIWYGVALAAPQMEPRRALRKRIMALVQNPDRFRLVWWQPVAALATLALAIFSGWQLASIRHEPAPVAQVVQPVAPAPVDNSQALARLEQQNEALHQRLAATEKAAQPLPPAADNSAELALLAATRQELARQKDLLAIAERNAAEADRKYVAATAPQPKPDVSEEQRLLGAAQTRTQQLERDLVQYKALLATARQRLESPSQAASVLADPNLKLVRLRATVRGSDIEGHALLASGSQVIFYGSQLPALPAGRAYQLWLIRGTAPAIVSAGVFQPNAQNRAIVKFESSVLTSGVTAIAVTDEPESGSVSPTGHKLLIGS